MIEDLRIINLKKQVSIITKNRDRPLKAAYLKRDSVTGDRAILTGNGGIAYVNLLSNSQPNEILNSVDLRQKTANQKPALPKDRPL